MSEMPPTVQQLSYAPPPPGRNLRKVATYQRGIIFCILGYMVAAVLSFVVPVPAVRIVLSLLAFGISVTGAVFVFMLAIQVYNVAAGVVLGICTLIPIVGLIILLVINGRATKVLRESGVRVGFLGANPATVPGYEV